MWCSDTFDAQFTPPESGGSGGVKCDMQPWARAAPRSSAYVNSALHPVAVAKSSTSVGGVKGENISSAGWQVTPRDPIRHVSSRRGVAYQKRTAIPRLLTFYCLNGGVAFNKAWLGSRVVSVLDSGAERPQFKSQSRRCPVTVLGKLFTPVVPLFTKQRNWHQPS